MDIQPIKSESDYRIGLKRLDTIFDAVAGTEESDEADVLALLIDEYEKKNIFVSTHPILSGKSFLQFYMIVQGNVQVLRTL